LRKQHLHEDFFQQVTKRAGVTTGGRTVQALITSTTKILNKLISHVTKKGRIIQMGTTGWKSTDSLTLDTPGKDVETIVEGNNKILPW
jgi:hypothetical protein